MNRTKATSHFFMYPKNLWATRPAAVLAATATLAATLATAGCVNEAGIQKPPASWTYKQNPETATDGRMHRTTGPQARYGQNGTEFQPTLGGSGGYQGESSREPLAGITEAGRKRAEAGTGSAPGAQRPASSFDLEQSQLKSTGKPSQPAASSLRPDPRDRPKAAGAPGAIAPGAVVGGQGAGGAATGAGTAGGMTSGGGANGAGANGAGATQGTSSGAASGSGGATTSPGTSSVIGTRSGAAGGGATGTGRP
jgi:hypothetical protein